MPEARIRVAALHLAGARALPLLCLGVRGGVQSRLVNHACSALKQKNCRAHPTRRTGERLLMSTLPRQFVLCPLASQNSLIPSSPLTKNAAPTPANTASVTALVKNSPFMDGH